MYSRRLRIALWSHKPGETRVVEFALASDDLAFFNNEAQHVLESGEFEVYVGGGSLALLAGRFEVVKQTVDAHPRQVLSRSKRPVF
jgi:Fibronectin type III-like domain